MAEIFSAFESLLDAMFNLYGPERTLWIALIAYLLFVARRIYLDRRKDNDSGKALKAQEQAVQRSAQEAREWRVMFFVEKAGWDLEDAERVVMEASFDNPQEARKALEKPSKKQSKKRKKK